MGISKMTTVLFLVVFVLISSYSSTSKASLDSLIIMHNCEQHIRKHLHIPIIDHKCECCLQVRRLPNVTAVCDAFTAEDLAKISLANWAKVTHKCGKALPEGTNCAGMFSLVINQYIYLNSFS